MNELTRAGRPFEALRHVDDQGEHWFARELQPLLDYAQWRQFNDAINRARLSVAATGEDVRHHFASVRKVTPGGRWGSQTVDDFRLTRYACYLVAMNGDTRKKAIADAQQYFAVKTRQAEVTEEAPQQPALPGNYLEALKALVVSVEAQQIAELKAEEAKAEAAMLRPPAEAWQTLVDTGQDYSMAEAAAILNRDPAIDTGQNRLRDWMLRNRILYRRGKGQLVPYSEHLAHIRLKPQSRPDHDADDTRIRKEANSQVRITVKGLEWIQQHMREQTKPVLVPALRPDPEVDPPINFDQFRLRALRTGR